MNDKKLVMTIEKTRRVMKDEFLFNPIDKGMVKTYSAVPINGVNITSSDDGSDETVSHKHLELIGSSSALYDTTSSTSEQPTETPILLFHIVYSEDGIYDDVEWFHHPTPQMLEYVGIPDTKYQDYILTMETKFNDTQTMEIKTITNPITKDITSYIYTSIDESNPGFLSTIIKFIDLGLSEISKLTMENNDIDITPLMVSVKSLYRYYVLPFVKLDKVLCKGGVLK